MRNYTKPLLNKSNLLLRILDAIRMVKPLCITPKDRAAIESLHGLDLILRNIKVNYKVVNIPAHKRNNGYVKSHKRRTGETYYLDVNNLLKQAGKDILIESIKNQINNLSPS